MPSLCTLTPDRDHMINNIRIKTCMGVDVEPHNHTFFELFYIKSGHIMHSLNNGDKISMFAGDYMLVDIGTYHVYDICDAEVINVAFTSTAITKHLPICTSFFQLLSYHVFSVIGTSSTPFPIDTILHDDDGRILTQIEMMRENTTLQLNEVDFMSAYIVKHQLISLILCIAKKYCTFDAPIPIGSLTQTILKIVSNHYKDPNPLNIAARETLYSHSTLSITFKNAMGIGFKEYLQRYRIDIAKHQLKTTDLKISDISSNIGYSDTKFFSKLFKEYVGVTPRDYRKNAHIDAPIQTI